MINNSNELGCSNKEEGNNKQPTNFYSTWSGLKNPRIVRVSRAFGGKDRHSKVTTVRGLRDRRVRLSVQTAIQLYDLQDKLGFNQPSKVVDWLINAAQHEIDKLPPLQVPPGSLFPFPQFVNPSSNISDNINRVQERYLQSNTVNAAMVKETSVGNSLDWNSKEAMKQMTNGDQASCSKTNLEQNQSFIMPNNSISQTPYNYQDSMNAYMHYLGNHSSQEVAYNPINSESTNFDWKHYNHFYTSTLPNISQRNQDFKNQRTQDQELGN